MESSPAPQLRRRPTGPIAARPRLDDDQRRAVASTADVVRVLGGPGTGTSMVAVETVVHAVRSGAVSPSQCVILTSSRLAAAGLRDAVTAGVGQTSTEPLARTHQSLGFGLLRQDAALRGMPTPRLLTGPEQDVILRELLDGHASGVSPAPAWPDRVVEALPTRGFRAELRDLLMRAVEHGLEPHDLIALADEHDRPEWAAAAAVLREYDEVTAMSAPGAYDPAWILTAAADLLEDDVEAFDRVATGIRLVVVDDAQELTHPAARLLRVLHRAGARLVLIGDPDVAVQTFRGADPRLMLGSWGRPGARVEEFVLGQGYRLPPALARVAGDVTARIGALGAGHQRVASPTTGGLDGEVSAHVLRSAAAEAGFIATQLRRAHLIDSVPWSQMAVITRGRGRTATMRRVLTAQSVPLAAPPTDVPVRDEVAVRPLLALMRIVIDLARGRQAEISVEALVDILTSPIGGADSVRLRRLRRTLRREELAAGGGRSSDELLTVYVRDPERLAHLGHEVAPLLRVARIIEAGLAAAHLTPDGHWPAGVTAETLLWELWQAAGLASSWQAAALAGG
ncbi:UvrD-helicase domain-containing protein, partial [Kribbia dieselivorans]|uniref:UvrD-helicase domain-containing protein n=1 Tax=Kribbia dieselivorans TaxID=331526 RepID=UPI000A8575F1